MDQGWPTGRSPSVTWSIAPDSALNWQDIQKNIFQLIFQKVHKIIHQLVGHIYSLVPLAMADHRLARQMWQRYCNMFFIIAWNHDLCVTDTLPSVHHLLRRWYTVFAHMILNFSILRLWLYYRPADRELSRNFQVDPSRRQVGHPWNRLLVYTTHTYESAQQTKQHTSNIRAAYYFHFAGKKFAINCTRITTDCNECSTYKIILFFCEYQNHSKENTTTIICDIVNRALTNAVPKIPKSVVGAA